MPLPFVKIKLQANADTIEVDNKNSNNVETKFIDL